MRETSLSTSTRVWSLGIYSINMHHQTLEMELQLEFMWYDQPFTKAMQTDDWQRGKKERGWQEQMRITAWHPGVMCLNCPTQSRRDWYSANEALGLIVFRSRLRGIFRERYEMSAFPFTRST